MSVRNSLMAIFTALILFSCNGVPDGVLNRKKMEQVLYDVHIAEGIMDEYPTRYRSLESKQELMTGVFRENGITKAEFDSSMVYYGGHLDLYMKIYQRVSQRLDAEKAIATDELIAYERSLLTPVGDSVEIWKGNPQIILDPALLATTRIFELKTDSNFRNNDKVIWSLHVSEVPADSVGYLYAALGYAESSDKVNQVTVLPAQNGWMTLEIAVANPTNAGRLFGSISLIGRNDSLLQTVYIDTLSLMRYHHQEPLVEKADSTATVIQTDSLSADSATLRPAADSSVKSVSKGVRAGQDIIQIDSIK